MTPVLLAMVSALIEGMLAQRFIVMALIPVVAVVVIFASVDAAAKTGSFFPFISAVVVIGALQSGYFTGAKLRRQEPSQVQTPAASVRLQTWNDRTWDVAMKELVMAPTWSNHKKAPWA